MKPNFALSLSHDRIRLLHRATTGWHLVGEVDTAADDLAAELAMLRRTATGLEPRGVRSKLLIPSDHIRYLTIDTPGDTTDARRAAAARALEGATPYAVADLVFDIEEDGDTTHVAAVAVETLAEAEAFAVQHRFHPVSYAAPPGADSFASGPDFGATKAATDLMDDGETVEKDAHPTQTDTAVTPADAGDQTAETSTPEFVASARTSAPHEPAFETVPDDADDTDELETAPGFVSRRTVPTFRTSASKAAAQSAMASVRDGAVPGFGEEANGFTAVSAEPKEPPRRSSQALPAPSATVSPTADEKERLTVFGARSGTALSHQGRRIALVCAVLVIVPLGIAAFASGAVSNGIARVLGTAPEPTPAVQFAAPLQPELLQEQTAPEDQARPSIELASLEQELSDEDAAVLEALQRPELEDIAPPAAPTLDQTRAAYAVTGIWPVAPDVPSPPPLVDLDDLYVTSIDPINPNFDAVALPALKSYRADEALLAPASPAPAGTVFTLNDRGLVIPSADGTLNPDGVLVYAGPPPVRQPSTLLRIEEPGEDLAQRIILAGFRPQSRPDDLIETNERATLSGLTRSELAQLRPRLRPQSAQENAAAAASLVRLDTTGNDAALVRPTNNNNAFDGATARAVAASLRPDARPNNFSAIVARTQRAQPTPPAASVSTASVAPRSVAPKIPSSASASRSATVKNAINLRKVNLIGVYGTPSSRRALVRLGNGRYRKVEVGDRIDGGLVSAIGDAELRYQKKGRAIVLKMPRG